MLFTSISGDERASGLVGRTGIGKANEGVATGTAPDFAATSDWKSGSQADEPTRGRSREQERVAKIHCPRRAAVKNQQQIVRIRLQEMARDSGFDG